MSDTQRWGATPDDWAHFDIWLGLTPDLLPVVSNPHAVISKRSTLTELGKVPSRYDTRREVVGFGKWTRRCTQGPEIERWMIEPDYGICLQTHRVRALDVDVTDHGTAAAVTEFIGARLGDKRLPRRERPNSSKFLLAFELGGEYKKREIYTGPGLKDKIEFLAAGQQFICAGTHPSGARYEWRGGLPQTIPALYFTEFEDLWSALGERFGTSGRRDDDKRTAATPAGQHALTIEDLRELLAMIPGNPDRGHWLRVLWALRSAWRESLGRSLKEADVLALADAYSRRGDTGKYSSFEDVRARFMQGDEHAQGRGVTWRSLLYYASQGGWRATLRQRERIDVSVLNEFENLEIGAIYGI